MNPTLTKILERAARYYVFLMLTIYGTGKIFGGQFYKKGMLPPEVASQTLGTVETFDLAWTFMGHSQAYILFVGISQLIGAFCLLFNRSKFIGIFILIPILVNIIVFDAIFFPSDEYGALASASFYLSLLMLVLYLNKPVVQEVLRRLTSKSLTNPLPRNLHFKQLAFSLLVVPLMFGLDQLLVNVFGI